MSYEGSEQHICANGHAFECDCYADNTTCHCGAKSVFCNGVDDTNYESYGIIPTWEWDKLELTPIKLEMCNLGRQHVIEEPTYKVPDNPELIRYWCEITYDKNNVYDDDKYHRIHDRKTFNSKGEPTE